MMHGETKIKFKVSASIGSVSHMPIILCSERPSYVTDRNVQKIHNPRQELQVDNKIIDTKRNVSNMINNLNLIM